MCLAALGSAVGGIARGVGSAFGGGGGSRTIIAPSVLPPLPPIPTEADPAIGRARAGQRQKAALAAGRSSTILTSPLGLTTEASTAKKRVLGA